MSPSEFETSTIGVVSVPCLGMCRTVRDSGRASDLGFEALAPTVNLLRSFIRLTGSMSRSAFHASVTFFLKSGRLDGPVCIGTARTVPAIDSSSRNVRADIGLETRRSCTRLAVDKGRRVGPRRFDEAVLLSAVAPAIGRKC
jgi:hypothetical protein